MQLRGAALGVGLALALSLGASSSTGQVVEVDVRTQVFHEPSNTSKMTVRTVEQGKTQTSVDAIVAVNPITFTRHTTNEQ